MTDNGFAKANLRVTHVTKFYLKNVGWSWSLPITIETWNGYPLQDTTSTIVYWRCQRYL